MRFGVVRSTPSFRANNDGAKILPEGDVTAEEGTRNTPTSVGGVGFGRRAALSLCPSPETTDLSD